VRSDHSSRDAVWLVPSMLRRRPVPRFLLDERRMEEAVDGITERIETVIIGGGQAGLAAGYHLAERGRPFMILDASTRIGTSWRDRWDSLVLFTPARYS